MSDNLTPIHPNPRPVKMTVGQIAEATSMAMLDRNYDMWPEYKGPKFVVASDHKGERLIFLSDKGVLTRASNAQIDAAILQYLVKDIPKKRKWCISPSPTMRTVKEVREFWFLSFKPIDVDMIKPVAFKSERSGHAFHRLGFDPAPIKSDFDLAASCPLVAEFMARTSNSQALMTWIGSIFAPQAYRQSYIWLHGSGNDGKGTLMNKLRRLLGPSFASEQPPAANARFWTSGILGKRLVVFPDVNDINFVTSGMFKSLTGGDPIRVEFKGGSIMTMDLNTLYMVISNDRPNISHGNADLRRLIFCHSGPPTEQFEDYDERMWEEMPAFISYCWHLYQNHARFRPGRPIPADAYEAIEIADENIEGLTTILDHHFSATGSGACVTAARVESVLRMYWKHDAKMMRKARRYLREVYGAKSENRKVREKQGEERVSRRVYTGLWERDPMRQML